MTHALTDADEGFSEFCSLPSLANGWSEEQKAEFAIQLLLTVSTPVLDSVIKRLSPVLQRDFLGKLPQELAAHILGYIDIQTLSRVAQISRKWRDVAYDNSVWHKLYVGSGWTVSDKYVAERLRWANDPEYQRQQNKRLLAALARYRADEGRRGGVAVIDELGIDEEDDMDGNGDVGIGREQSDDPVDTESLLGTSFSSTGSLEHGLTSGLRPYELQSPSPDTARLFQGMSIGESVGDLSQFELRNDQMLFSRLQAKWKSKPLIDWRHIFKQRMLLEKNWAEKRYQTKTFSGHTEAVYCLQFDHEKIISGSRDDTIKIWDIHTGACKVTLRGHTGSVLCLQYDDTRIVSGSSDSTILIWDLASFTVDKSLSAHTESVLNLRFDDRYIVSCSKDTTVRVWDTNSGRLIHTMTGHRAAVNAVQYQNGLVVSASGDRSIKVWNVHTGQLMRNLSGHSRGIACIQFDGNTIVSGSSDSTIRVWNVHTGEQTMTITGHMSLVRTLQFDSRRIISGSYDETLKVWDMKTGALLMDLKEGGHSSRIFKLLFNDTKIVSCSQDQRIIVWDFGIGVDARYFV